MNYGYRYTDRITPAQAGKSVLAFYSDSYRHSSESEWRERIAAGRVLLRGGTATEDDILRAGDVLVYVREAWEEPAAAMETDVLASGAGWMVFNKPTGLPVLPGAGFLEHTLLHAARKNFGEEVAPVHRLGRGTTGAILFSRGSEAAAFLACAMRERRVKKTYLTLVAGLPEDDEFTVDVPIGPVPHSLLGTVHAASSTGKPSISHCTVLRRDAGAGCSLVEVRIPTGRPHQIRIHLAAAGYPLLGDPLYAAGGLPFAPDENGGQPVPGDCGYTLHSWKLSFPDPDGGVEREVIAPPPPSLS